MITESQEVHDVPLASIIIVTYNSAAVLQVCLDALYVGAVSKFEVVVFDNNSSDNSCHISQHHPAVTKLIRSSSNLGFAKAVNRAVQESSGQVIVLLNPDAIATVEQLQTLVDRALGEQSAAWAPTIIHPGARLQILSAGRFPTLWRMFAHYTGVSRLFRGARVEGHYLLPHNVTGIRSVEWATGACLVVPRTIWNKVGGMTERWFMYAEDIEFCWRMHRAGFELKLANDVLVAHAVGTGTNEPSSMRPDWILNLWHFYDQDISDGRLGPMLWKIVVSAGLLSRSAVYLSRACRRPDSQAWLNEANRFRHFALALLSVRSEREEA